MTTSSTTYRVAISRTSDQPDGRALKLVRDLQALGIDAVARATITDLYFLQGQLTTDEARALAEALLLDPVIHRMTVLSLPLPNGSRLEDENGDAAVVEVARRPGVTDTEAESLLRGAVMLGFGSLEAAATGKRYTLHGADAPQAELVARALLANEVVERFSVGRPIEPSFVATEPATGAVATVALTSLDDDDALLAVSQERRLSLDLYEMRAIRDHFRTQGREPSDVELEMLAQTWSEHCVHKTFRAHVVSHEIEADGTSTRHEVHSMLRSFLRAATEACDRGDGWVVSALEGDAGVVRLDDDWDLAFKVETHNHPSAIEPFGGANTGVGGVIRDVLATGARPIATTDVLCFGPLDTDPAHLPPGTLHPRRVAQGVIAGIEDYGNKMGIPTVSGAILYDEGYLANPLVYCGCLGLMPRGSVDPTAAPAPGDLVVAIGGRTGRDGLRGATFSSMEMDHETSAVAGSSVQIGHPIQEKQVLEVILEARREELYRAMTDCGAGGFSSAVGEMAETLGARVELERVSLKYPGLEPWEIWLSEAQERMVLAVPPEDLERFEEICRSHGVEATVLGLFTGTGRLEVLFADRPVADLDVSFLHGGRPPLQLEGRWQAPPPEPAPPAPESWSEELLALLATHEIRSKEEVVRQYDHEVQGGTVVKPLVGHRSTGPSDASVLLPLDAARSGAEAAVALSVGINPHYGRLDPHRMSWLVIDEAVRNLVAVGADPDRVALLDNFCWGNPRRPDRMGALLRCTRGCFEAAVAYGAPFISGKDSLNNEYTGPDTERHAIPGTLLISALGIVPDVERTATSDLKSPSARLYLMGPSDEALGASAYARRRGQPTAGSLAPQPQGALEHYRRLHRAIGAGLVRTCHDPSEGGLLVALAEMAIGGGLGLEVDLANLPASPGQPTSSRLSRAFGESAGRMVVEVEEQAAPAFEEAMEQDMILARLGRVLQDRRMIVRDGQETLVSLELSALERAWRGHVPSMRSE